MSKIDFNQKIEGKKQMVFVILYALDGQPWQSYEGASEKAKNLTIPTCLMINREDGRIGFVGGAIEEGETLKEAMKREIKEEVDFELSSDLEPLVAHDLGHITAHVFVNGLTYAELRELQRRSVDAPHFGSEVTGVFLPHLIDYEGMGGKGGLVELLRHSVAPKVRDELAHFLIQKNVFEKEKLADIYQRAGFSLDEHLQ